MLARSVMPLPRGLLQKLKGLVIANGLNGELQAAFNHVGKLGHIQPTGKGAAVRNFDNVKSNTENQSGGVLFGGSLSQLALQHRAMSTIDIGKLGYIIENATTDAILREMIKPIVVNIDAGNASHYVRANKDAEIDGLSLLMLWCSGDEPLSERLKAVAADLVFEARKLGDGSKVFSAQFDLISLEENERNVIGVSTWRMCLFFCRLSKEN